jgi:hypothetical protein
MWTIVTTPFIPVETQTGPRNMLIDWMLCFESTWKKGYVVADLFKKRANKTVNYRLFESY